MLISTQRQPLIWFSVSPAATWSRTENEMHLQTQTQATAVLCMYDTRYPSQTEQIPAATRIIIASEWGSTCKSSSLQAAAAATAAADTPDRQGPNASFVSFFHIVLLLVAVGINLFTVRSQQQAQQTTKVSVAGFHSIYPPPPPPPLQMLSVLSDTSHDHWKKNGEHKLPAAPSGAHNKTAHITPPPKRQCTTRAVILCVCVCALSNLFLWYDILYDILYDAIYHTYVRLTAAAAPAADKPIKRGACLAWRAWPGVAWRGALFFYDAVRNNGTGITIHNDTECYTMIQQSLPWSASWGRRRTLSPLPKAAAARSRPSSGAAPRWAVRESRACSVYFVGVLVCLYVCLLVHLFVFSRFQSSSPKNIVSFLETSVLYFIF